MSAASALRAARLVGISFAIEGDDLLLEAPAPPPPEVIEAICQHKSEILILLRSSDATWSSEDWQALFDERAGVVEHDGVYGRLDAEMIAFEDCVDHWLAINPPPLVHGKSCVYCTLSVSPEEQASVAVPCSGGTVGWLHSECASTWKNLRRWKARSALIWPLQPPKGAVT